MAWIILIGLSCIGVLALGFYAYFNYSIKAMYISQTLAKDIEITSDKVEIIAETPLKAKKQIQEIALSIDGYKPDISNHDSTIKLNNGTVIEPKIELVDENNDVHQLKVIGQSFNADGVLVRFREINEPSKHISYKAVRISSYKPFRCDVYWKDYDLK